MRASVWRIASFTWCAMVWPERTEIVSSTCDMQVDVKLQPHFADETFLHVQHSRHRGRRRTNRLDDHAARRRIHDLVQRGIEQAPAIGRDQAAGEKRRPGVRALPILPAEQRDRDADKSRDRSERIGPMMPGIGLDGGALERVTPPPNDAEKDLLHEHDDDEDDEGERARACDAVERFRARSGSRGRARRRARLTTP